jgi:hypothetical protein
MNAYQKLKEKNKVHEREIHILIFQPDSAEANSIRSKYWLLQEIENAIMARNPNKDKPNLRRILKMYNQ